MFKIDNEYIRECGEIPQKLICCCDQCGELLYEGETAYKDMDDNYFCSHFCYEEFHQIEEIIL